MGWKKTSDLDAYKNMYERVYIWKNPIDKYLVGVTSRFLQNTHINGNLLLHEGRFIYFRRGVNNYLKMGGQMVIRDAAPPHSCRLCIITIPPNLGGQLSTLPAHPSLVPLLPIWPQILICFTFSESQFTQWYHSTLCNIPVDAVFCDKP